MTTKTVRRRNDTPFLLFQWDWGAYMENEKKYLQETEGLPEEDAYKQATFTANDFAWEEFIEQVEWWLNENVPEGERLFYVEASKVGWRNHSGQKVLAAETGEDFIRGVSGLDCDFTARFWESNKWLCTATISHHDSPTGEPRRVMTLRDWINRQVDNYSIQKLQTLLTKLRQTEYLFRDNCIGARWEWWDEDMVGKPRRYYTKEDFAHIFLQYYLETDILLHIDLEEML